MQSIIEALRSVLGTPNFYINEQLNYGAMFEYLFAGTITCIVVGSIFRILVRWGGR